MFLACGDQGCTDIFHGWCVMLMGGPHSHASQQLHRWPPWQPHPRPTHQPTALHATPTSRGMTFGTCGGGAPPYEGQPNPIHSHPLDQQNTMMLRALPGLETMSKAVMGTRVLPHTRAVCVHRPITTGPVAEQVLLLENISTSVLVGPDQLPHIHTLMVEAAHMLQMEPPDLYIRQNPVPNAYTLAISGRKPFVVVHTALLELLTPAELQTVLAHELGHLKCDHGLWLTAANVLAMGTVSLLPIISSRVYLCV